MAQKISDHADHHAHNSDYAALKQFYSASDLAAVQKTEKHAAEPAHQSSDLQSNQYAETLSKLVTTIAVGLAIRWFSGPYMAIAARQIYELIYTRLLGTYAWYDPRYYSIFVPAREHVGHLAFEYGPTVSSTLIAPFIYMSVGRLWRFGKTVAGKLFGVKSQPDSQAVSKPELDAAIESLRMQLECLKLDENITPVYLDAKTNPNLLYLQQNNVRTDFANVPQDNPENLFSKTMPLPSVKQIFHLI